MRQAAGTHAADCPCATGWRACATGWRGLASLPVGLPDLSPQPPALIPHHLHAVLAAALLLVVSLLPNVARGQNALQQFAGCMGGPAAAANCTATDFDASDTCDGIDAIGFQLVGALLSTSCSAMTLPYDRQHAGMVGFFPEAVVGASTLMTVKPGALCTPNPGVLSASFAWVGIASLDSTKWAQIGFVHGVNFTATPCDALPSGTFTRVYFEINCGTPVGSCASYVRVWPNTPVVTGSTLYFGVSVADPATGRFRGFVYDPDAFQFLYLDEVVQSQCAGPLPSLASYVGEATAGAGDRIPGVATNKFEFTDCEIVRAIPGSGQVPEVAGFLSRQPLWRPFATLVPLVRIPSTSDSSFRIWDVRP